MTDERLPARTARQQPGPWSPRPRPWQTQDRFAVGAFPRNGGTAGPRPWPTRDPGPQAGAAARTAPLPDRLRAGIEELSGVSLSDVTVHHGSAVPAGFDALALTRGNEIHLGPGQERHLPHEAWHVVQQRQGRVRSTGQVGEVALNQDQALEREADEASGRAERRGVSPAPSAAGQAVPSGAPPVQRKIATRDDSVTVTTHEELLGLLDKVTQAQPRYRGLVQWYLKFWFDVDYEFRDYQAIEAYVLQLVKEWEQELADLGVGPEELPAAYEMYNLLDKADPQQDEAVIHKLVYPYIKKKWVETKGGGEGIPASKGTVYNPIVNGEKKHTMPLNFSWLVALAHHKIKIRIIVPVTKRVLIREKTGRGKVLTDMDKVLANEKEAPLSATAREILGLLESGFYALSENESTPIEKVLVPTGKGALAFPKDVQIPRTMLLSELTQRLGAHHLEIQEDSVAVDYESSLELKERVKVSEQVKGFVGEDTNPNYKGRTKPELSSAKKGVTGKPPNG